MKRKNKIWVKKNFSVISISTGSFIQDFKVLSLNNGNQYFTKLSEVIFVHILFYIFQDDEIYFSHRKYRGISKSWDKYFKSLYVRQRIGQGAWMIRSPLKERLYSPLCYPALSNLIAFHSCLKITDDDKQLFSSLLSEFLKFSVGYFYFGIITDKKLYYIVNGYTEIIYFYNSSKKLISKETFPRKIDQTHKDSKKTFPALYAAGKDSNVFWVNWTEKKDMGEKKEEKRFELIVGKPDKIQIYIYTAQGRQEWKHIKWKHLREWEFGYCCGIYCKDGLLYCLGGEKMEQVYLCVYSLNGKFLMSSQKMNFKHTKSFYVYQLNCEEGVHTIYICSHSEFESHCGLLVL